MRRTQEQPNRAQIEARRQFLFDVMLANPANLDAAFEYAALSAGVGELEAAVSTLEGLLNVLKDGVVTFARLKQEHSDTQQLPYFVVNKGFKPRARSDGFGEVNYEAYYPIPRKVAFALRPGEVGLAEYHDKHCPDGWRIVMRLR